MTLFLDTANLVGECVIYTLISWGEENRTMYPKEKRKAGDVNWGNSLARNVKHNAAQRRNRLHYSTSVCSCAQLPEVLEWDTNY